MKSLGSTLVLICGLLLLDGAGARDMLHFPLFGFSIAPLEARSSGPTSVVMEMFLPPSGGFAPNVRVEAQKWPGTLDQYVEVSQKQFEKAGFKVINSSRPDASTAIFEFTGTLQNHPLHWYAKASLGGGEVLLTTATATEQQWPTNGQQLQACVNSFRRD